MGNVIIFEDDNYKEVDDYIFEDFGSNHEINKEMNNDSTARYGQTQKDDITAGKNADKNELLKNEKTARENILKEAEIIKKQAHDEGYNEGYKEGKDKSLEEFTKHIKSCADSVILLNGTIDVLKTKYEKLENSVADSVIALAEKVVARHLNEDKTAIVSMTKEALGLTETNRIKIKLNSEDAGVIKKYIENIEDGKNIEILADENLKRGSIIIEEENGNIIDAGTDAKFEQMKSKLINE